MKTSFHHAPAALLAGGALLAGAAAPLLAAPAPSYHLARKIALTGDGRWDYLTLDSAAKRLYISRSTHVNVVDLTTGTVVGDVPETSGVHGIAIDPKSGHGFTSNGRANTVTIFDLKTLAKVAEVAVGTGPDCIIFEPSQSEFSPSMAAAMTRPPLMGRPARCWARSRFRAAPSTPSQTARA